MQSPDDDQATAVPSWWAARGINRFGIAWFFAEAPGTALSGRGIYSSELVEPMRAGLQEWANGPIFRLLEVLEQQLAEQVADRLDLATVALGLPNEQRDAIESWPTTGPDRGTQIIVGDVALARVDLIFEELRTAVRSDDRAPVRFEVSHPRATYALAVLSAALVGRESEDMRIGSLDTLVLEVPGGLLMPPFVVLLSLLFTRHYRGLANAGTGLALETT